MITASNASRNQSIPGQTELAMVTAPLDAVSLWRELRSGRTRIAALHLTEQFVVAKLSDPLEKPRASFRSWRVLECMLSGESQKCISFRMGLATSTVSLHARAALGALGIDCEPSRAPLFVFMLFNAAGGSMHFRGAHVAVLDEDGCTQRFACFPRPDRGLDDLLSPAEVEVARHRLMGATSALIALKRRTASRTVANQLAHTYRRLGVSGRVELICKLLANLSDAPGRAGLDLASHLDLLHSSGGTKAEATDRRVEVDTCGLG
jgi:DNA-binding NarL/FixJ family response regulator